MSDLIDRQAAIDFIDAGRLGIPNEPRWSDNEVVAFLKSRPSVYPEQKKREWVIMSGFCTPGGDPVWCCPECGKGIHVWGIEGCSYGGDVAEHQWVACPNCGVRLE